MSELQSNYERYFGTPALAAESISRLVDEFDYIRENRYDGQDYRSEFTDHFRPGGDCEYGFIHQDTLLDWLMDEWDGWTLEQDIEQQRRRCERLRDKLTR